MSAQYVRKGSKCMKPEEAGSRVSKSSGSSDAEGARFSALLEFYQHAPSENRKGTTFEI
jgi:hypothetical protein